MFVFNPIKETLQVVETKGEIPQGLFSHCAIARGKDIVYFGGSHRENSKMVETSETQLFNTETHQWTKLPVSGEIPPGIQGHQCAIKAGKLYVFGGFSGRVFQTNVYELDLQSGKWAKVDGSMKPRAFHALSVVDSNAYLYGGTNTNQKLADLKVFNLLTKQWVEPLIAQLPLNSVPRQGLCSATFGSKILLFGGKAEWNNNLNDIFLIDTDYQRVHKDPYVQNQKTSTAIDENSELLEKIRASILNYENMVKPSLANQQQTPHKASVELEEIIKKDKEEEEGDAKLKQRLELWDTVDTIFKLMNTASGRIRNINNNMQIDLNNIRQMEMQEIEAYDKLTKTYAELKAKYEIYQARKLQLKTEMDQRHFRKATLENESKGIRQLEASLLELRSKIEECLLVQEKLKKEMVILEEQKAALAKEFTQTQIVTLEEESKQLNSTLLKLRGQLNEHEKQKENVTRILNDKSTLLSEIKEKLQLEDPNRKELEHLKELQMEALMVQKKFLEKKLQMSMKIDPGKENDNADAQQTAHNRQELELLEAKLLATLSGYTEKEKHLQSDIDGLQKRLQSLREDIHKVKGQESKTAQDLANKQEQITSIRASNRDRQQILASNQKTYEDAVQRLNEKEAECKKWTISVENIEKEILSKKKEAQEKQKFYDEACNAVANAERMLTEAKNQLSIVEDSFEDQYDTVMKITLRLETLRHDIQATTGIYKQQRKEFDERRKQLKVKLVETEQSCKGEIEAVNKELQVKIQQQEEKIRQLESALATEKVAREKEQNVHVEHILQK